MVDAVDVRKSLTRILHDQQFKRSKHSVRLLHYVVSETLEGRAAVLKELTIAMTVFGRGLDFGGWDDNVVRVNAFRLRKALKRYYDGPGADDPISISIAPGTYVPTFEPNERAPSNVEVEGDSNLTSPEAGSSTSGEWLGPKIAEMVAYFYWVLRAAAAGQANDRETACLSLRELERVDEDLEIPIAQRLTRGKYRPQSVEDVISGLRKAEQITRVDSTVQPRKGVNARQGWIG